MFDVDGDIDILFGGISEGVLAELRRFIDPMFLACLCV